MDIIYKSNARPKEGWILAVRRLARYLTGSEQLSLFGSHEGRTDRQTDERTRDKEGTGISTGTRTSTGTDWQKRVTSILK